MPGAASFKSNYHYLEAQLAVLDLVLKRCLARLKGGELKKMNISLDAGYVISEREIQSLLAKESESGGSDELSGIDRQLANARAALEDRTAAAMQAGVALRLPQLKRLFALSDFEAQVLLVCLAPELNRKYDRIYAYLQDDVTRRKPSVDLVLQLLCDSMEEKIECQKWFSNNGALSRFDLLVVDKDQPQAPRSSFLSAFIELDPRIKYFIIDHPSIGEELKNKVDIIPPRDLDPSLAPERAGAIVEYLKKRNGPQRETVFYLSGKPGVGKRSLALQVCRRLQRPLVYLDFNGLDCAALSGDVFFRSMARECALNNGVLYFDNCERLAEEGAAFLPALRSLFRAVSLYQPIVFFAGKKPGYVGDFFQLKKGVVIDWESPSFGERVNIWNYYLAANKINHRAHWAADLASRYTLTAGQVEDAVHCAVENSRFMAGKTVDFSALGDAVRMQSYHKLKDLALKVAPVYTFNDLMLPEARERQLREICSHISHKDYVFSEWAFEKKYSYGKGLSVLFYGPPGTGKTMAAEVLARENNLDLYKIDLSRIVSKYIGETEKNLARVFAEAEGSNAILFFDESDALFGKRTEIHDSHDRYANVEVSYLLQKIEEYEGTVILSTNLKQNIDQAFLRRIKFFMEFPYPDADSRYRIWKSQFPEQAPLHEDVDFRFLAERFKLTGANIRNIAFTAALLGAENGRVIRRSDIFLGIQREYDKIGRFWKKDEFICPPT